MTEEQLNNIRNFKGARGNAVVADDLSSHSSDNAFIAEAMSNGTGKLHVKDGGATWIDQATYKLESSTFGLLADNKIDVVQNANGGLDFNLTGSKDFVNSIYGQEIINSLQGLTNIDAVNDPEAVNRAKQEVAKINADLANQRSVMEQAIDKSRQAYAIAKDKYGERADFLSGYLMPERMADAFLGDNKLDILSSEGGKFSEQWFKDLGVEIKEETRDNEVVKFVDLNDIMETINKKQAFNDAVNLNQRLSIDKEFEDALYDSWNQNIRVGTDKYNKTLEVLKNREIRLKEQVEQMNALINTGTLTDLERQRVQEDRNGLISMITSIHRAGARSFYESYKDPGISSVLNPLGVVKQVKSAIDSNANVGMKFIYANVFNKDQDTAINALSRIENLETDPNLSDDQNFDNAVYSLALGARLDRSRLSDGAEAAARGWEMLPATFSNGVSNMPFVDHIGAYLNGTTVELYRQRVRENHELANTTNHQDVEFMGESGKMVYGGVTTTGQIAGSIVGAVPVEVVETAALTGISIASAGTLAPIATSIKATRTVERLNRIREKVSGVAEIARKAGKIKRAERLEGEARRVAELSAKYQMAGQVSRGFLVGDSSTFIREGLLGLGRIASGSRAGARIATSGAGTVGRGAAFVAGEVGQGALWTAYGIATNPELNKPEEFGEQLAMDTAVAIGFGLTGKLVSSTARGFDKKFGATAKLRKQAIEDDAQAQEISKSLRTNIDKARVSDAVDRQTGGVGLERALTALNNQNARANNFVEKQKEPSTPTTKTEVMNSVSSKDGRFEIQATPNRITNTGQGRAVGEALDGDQIQDVIDKLRPAQINTAPSVDSLLQDTRADVEASAARSVMNSVTQSAPSVQPNAPINNQQMSGLASRLNDFKQSVARKITHANILVPTKEGYRRADIDLVDVSSISDDSPMGARATKTTEDGVDKFGASTLNLDREAEIQEQSQHRSEMAKQLLYLHRIVGNDIGGSSPAEAKKKLIDSINKKGNK